MAVSRLLSCRRAEVERDLVRATNVLWTAERGERYIPCGPQFIAATPVRQISTSPSGFMMAMNWSILERTGDLEDEMLGVGVDNAGAERVGQSQRFDAALAGAGDLHQRQFPLQRRSEPSSCARTDRSTTR